MSNCNPRPDAPHGFDRNASAVAAEIRVQWVHREVVEDWLINMAAGLRKHSAEAQ